MAVFKCKMCGADLEENLGNNIYECQYCGTRQTVSMESGLEAVVFSLLGRAKSYLNNENYLKANEYFDKVLDFAPENEEALLGKLLVEFKMKSIEELVENTVIFIFSENYKLLIEKCSFEMKQKLDAALQKVKENFEIALDALAKEGNAYVAKEICKRILVIDKENKKAILYNLLTSYFVTSIDSLAKLITPFTDSKEYKAVLEYCDSDTVNELEVASEQIRQNMLKNMEEAMEKRYYVGAQKLASNYLKCYPTNDTVLLYKFLADINVVSLKEAEDKLYEIYNSPEYSDTVEKCSNRLKKELQETSDRIKAKITANRKKQQIKKTIVAAVTIGIFVLFFVTISIMNNSPMTIYSYSNYKNGVVIDGINKPEKAIKNGCLEIPEKIGGKTVYGVSNIENNLFSSVMLPDTVTVIGENAFNKCTQLKEVNIPDSVKIIGEKAFYGCTSLKEIIIPSGVNVIHANAFFGCTALEEIYVPNSVTEICERAFSGCTSLREIFIPESVTTIEKHVFKDCTNLTIFCQVKEKPITWEFSWNTNFRPTVWGVTEKGVTENGLAWCKYYDNTISIRKYVGTQANVVIPSMIDDCKVTRIDDNAFAKKIGVISIEIPDTVKTIGAQAFCECNRLRTIKLPKDLKYVETKLFFNCNDLKTVEIPWGVVEIKESVFEGCSSLTDINIPNTVTSIGNSVFYDCRALASIDVPDNVTNIGGYAFYGCTSISSFKIPNALVIIGEFAFSNCKNLKSIEIPNGVTTIRRSAFNDCSSLTSVTIPDSVVSIGEEAFSGCIKLTSIIIPTGVTYVGGYAFEHCSDLTIYCEASSQPSKWNSNWDYNCPVVWGHKKQYHKKQNTLS